MTTAIIEQKLASTNMTTAIIEAAPFYSERNLKRLRKSIAGV